MAASATAWSAVAEHGQPAAAEPEVNIAFANMSWKEGPKDITRQVWISFGAAAEHVEFLQTPGKPYLTAYRTDHVTCEHYSVLSDLTRLGWA